MTPIDPELRFFSNNSQKNSENPENSKYWEIISWAEMPSIQLPGWLNCVSDTSIDIRILGTEGYNFKELFQDWCNISGNLHLDIWLSLSSHECITSRSLIQTLFIWSSLIKFIIILPLSLSLFFLGIKASTFSLPLSTLFLVLGVSVDWASASPFCH